jgi:hypothetical protein
MAMTIGVVYDPPDPGLPHIAVVVMDGKVICAEAVESVKEGDALLARLAKGLAEISSHFG